MRTAVMRIGVICALNAEANTLPARSGRWCGHDDFQVVVSGPGQEPAAQAAMSLRERGCAALVSWGLAGGLASTLPPRTLIVADTVVGVDGARMSCDPSLRQTLHTRLQPNGALLGSIYSAALALATAADKAEIQHRTGCIAVDMEAAAIARVADSHGLAFAAIRCIVDPAAFDLPSAALAGMHASGDTQALATLAAVMRHPGQIPDLLRLAWWYRGALGTLRDAGARLCH